MLVKWMLAEARFQPQRPHKRGKSRMGVGRFSAMALWRQTLRP